MFVETFSFCEIFIAPAAYPNGVRPVNPDKEGINNDLAEDFVTWITSEETQTAIGEFGVEQYGQPLFYPDAEGE